MFLLFLTLVGIADVPNPHESEHDAQKEIIVSSTRYAEIYVEDPMVISNGESSSIYEHDSITIFTKMNQKHRTWYTQGKVSGVYNDETIGFQSDCNYKTNSLKCANQDGLWVLRTIINEDPEQATVNMLLFDENGVVIGQSSISKTKKVNIIERQKTTTTQGPTQQGVGYARNCDQQNGSCVGGSFPINSSGNTTTQVEDLEPTVIELPPKIRDRDIDQAVIMLYLSINY